MFFNLKEMEKAKLYHLRTILTKFEPKNSKIRIKQEKLVRTKYHKNQKKYQVLNSRLLKALNIQVLKKFSNGDFVSFV